MQCVVNNAVEIDGNTYDNKDVLNIFRLQKELYQTENILATLEECARIWINYSGDLAASWLDFPKEGLSIVDEIKSSDYFTDFNKYSEL